MRPLLVGLVLALIASVPAAAAPGQPTLFYIPPKVQPNSAGGTQVSFGWREVAFDGTKRLYEVYTDDLTTGSFGPAGTVNATGDTSQDATITLSLTNGHRYRIYLYASQNAVRGPTSDKIDFTFDNQGPDVDFYLLQGVTSFRWVPKPTVQAYVSRNAGSDASRWEVSIGSDPWPCSSGFGSGCSDALRNGSGMRDVELPSPDGVKYVYVRMRDDALRTVISRSPPLNGAPVGNVGAVRSLSVGLDTTAPVTRLASADLKVTAGQAASLDATPSTDASSGVNAAAYEWRWGDGTTQTKQPGKTTHTYPGPGTYNGTVIVTDGVGLFSSKTFKVTVDPAPVDTTTTTTTSPPPESPPTPAPAPDPSPSPTPTPPPAEDRPAGAGSDIPLEELPSAVKAQKGPIARAKVSQVVEPKADIDVKLKLRTAAKVKLTLVDASGKVVRRDAERAKAGKDTVDIRAPKLPGEYTLLVKAPGQKVLALAVTVAGQV